MQMNSPLSTFFEEKEEKNLATFFRFLTKNKLTHFKKIAYVGSFYSIGPRLTWSPSSWPAWSRWGNACICWVIDAVLDGGREGWSGSGGGSSWTPCATEQPCSSYGRNQSHAFMLVCINCSARITHLFATQLVILSFLISNYFKTLFIIVPLCHVI